MKKTLLIALMLMMLHQPIYASREINFSGTLVEEPCILDPNDSALELDTGTVINKLLYSHSRTPGKPFSLHLLECDLSLGNTVTVTFMGTEDSEQPGLIALQSTSTAEGVALGIETPNNLLLPINKPSSTVILREGNNSIDLMYFISASKHAIENKQIKPGSVNYSLPFSLEYE